MIASLSPTDLAGTAPCAACPGALDQTPEAGVFARALLAAIGAGQGADPAGSALAQALTRGLPATTPPAQDTEAPAAQAHAQVAADPAPATQDPGSVWSGALLAVGLPFAATPSTPQAPAGPAPRPIATSALVSLTKAAGGLPSRLAMAEQAAETGPANLAVDRQALPVVPDAVSVPATVGPQGGAQPPGKTDAALPPPLVGETLARGPGLPGAADPHAAILDRFHELGRQLPGREQLALQLPLRSSGWDTELAQRVVWMAGRQMQWAEITVTPPNLGSIEVHLSLRGHDASAYFYSPHAVVREAIDEGLNRLKEMMAAAGIQLGQAQVGQESLTQRQTGAHLPPTGVQAMARLSADAAPVSLRRGLVDLYV